MSIRTALVNVSLMINKVRHQKVVVLGGAPPLVVAKLPFFLGGGIFCLESSDMEK